MPKEVVVTPELKKAAENYREITEQALEKFKKVIVREIELVIAETRRIQKTFSGQVIQEKDWLQMGKSANVIVDFMEKRKFRDKLEDAFKTLDDSTDPKKFGDLSRGLEYVAKAFKAFK